jgi:hypothetical protein
MATKRDRFLASFARAIEDEGRRSVQCPICGIGSIKFRYTADEESRVGYCDAWCGECLNGVHISRVKVPAGIHFTFFDDVDTEGVPEFVHLE